MYHRAMIEISQWRSCIGQFAQKHPCAVCISLVLVHRGGGYCRPCLTLMCVLVIATCTLLLMGGDVEPNPGPNGKKG